MPRGGNIPALLLAVPLIAAAVAALGLWLGSLFDRGERAMQVLVPTSVPLFFLSGSAWPLEQMPNWLAAVSHLAPSTLGVHIFVPLNQMGASLGGVTGKVALLAGLVALYGSLAFYRLTRQPGRTIPVDSR